MRKKDNTKARPGLRVVAARAPEPEPDELECFTPPGWREGDETLALAPVDNVLAYAGLYEGDVALIYETADVRPDDLAAVKVDGETWLGKYRAAPGGYFTFDVDGAVRRFRPGTALLIGRVCHFERGGEIVRKFRPIR